MDYYKFFKNLLLFTIILYCADYAIGEALRHYYFKSTHSANFATRYSMDSTKAQLVIFGSSRANHHYNPDIFEKASGLTAYNCGRDGNFLFYYYAVFKTLSERYTPKVVILDVLENELFTSPDAYDRLNTLLPYYANHPGIRPIINKRSQFEKFKFISHIYPYNSQLLPIIDGNMNIKGAKNEQALKGYIPLSGQWNEPEELYNPKITTFDNNKIEAYKDFIKICLQKNIRLVIVVSPYYIKNVTKSKSIALMQTIAKNNHVEFLDYANTDILADKKFFHDAFHLNATAVPIFDSILTTQIFKKQ